MAVLTVENRDAIAVVTINNPPVNALSQSLREALLQAIKEIDNNGGIEAIVLCCAGRTFIAGADISEFNQPPVPPHLPDVVNRLEQSKKPWVAALHGTVLGGGLEVALACHYRVAISPTKLGFPEVNLGLIPGAGGTVRLTRVVSPNDAVNLVTSGKPISEMVAHQMGLVDKVVNSSLTEQAIFFAKEAAAKPLPEPTSALPIKTHLDEKQWTEIYQNLRKRSRGQMAPLVAFDVIKKGVQSATQEALTFERASFLELKNGQQSKTLRYIFSAEKATAKLESLKNTTPLDITEVGVIGGGTMGCGIAAAFLLAGYRVKLLERQQDTLDNSIDNTVNLINNSLTRGVIDQLQFENYKSNISGNTDYASLSTADIVIEAVFEKMDVKRDVFSSLEAHTKPTAILATNTSYLDVNTIASSLNDPTRVVGMHFFSPAHIMKLLEVIRTDFVDLSILATVIQLAKKLRKIPVISGVCEGFIGNRIMSAYRKECEFMLEDGALPQDIDQSMMEFGFPMGIFAMQDLAGLDISWAMRKRLTPTCNADERYVAIADRLCELGRFGRKTGAGWYQYPDGVKQGVIDSLVESIIFEHSTLKSIVRNPISNETIIARILQTMQKEGSKILAENIANSARDIDVVMVNGYGFPRWKGGPMHLNGTA